MKYFTIDEANHALTLVRPIVSDILEKMRAAERIHGEVKGEKTRAAMSEITLSEKLKEAEQLLNKVEYHMKELESVGVSLKDLHIGLVDFPCMNGELVVFLCWKFGESEIAFWHEANRGFADRKAVDESFHRVSV